jgi:PAS domain S-box-containing protein
MTSSTRNDPFQAHRDPLAAVAEAVPAMLAYITPERRYAAANRAYRDWLTLDPSGARVADVTGPVYDRIAPHLDRALGGHQVTVEIVIPSATGDRTVDAVCIPDLDETGTARGVVVHLTDVDARRTLEQELREEAASSATLVRVGQALSREFDLQELVQTITDEATRLAGAQFGAFFYNVLTEQGESYTLYTISGVPREAFSRFPMPRNTKIFDPTFRGAGVVRFDDVTAQKEYGQNPPYHGMPHGHLPVRSYLAVPVMSASGAVLGGLFFGHARPGIFTARTESVILALASQAGVAIDNSRLVTALRRQRSEAEEAGRLYRFLADIVPQLLWTADPAGAVDYSNARWTEYTGLDQAASAGSGWQAAIHPDDRQRAAMAWTNAVVTGDPYEVTARLTRGSDGRHRWFLNRAYPLRNEQGTVVRWFGSWTDIHDQKRHEDAERLLSEASRALASSLDLEASLSTVAALVAAWFEGYCIIDLLDSGRLTRVAAAHCDAERQEVMEEFRNYAPGADHDNPIWRVLDSGTTAVCNQITDTQIRAAAQSSRHAELRRLLGTTGYIITPLKARGESIGTIMLGASRGGTFEPEDVRPIEELAYRVAMAVTNARAYQAARDASRLKDDFLAVVSHELRTPLNAMRGWTALLRSKRLDADRERQALDVIERNVNAQAQLVDDLLDISRIISGKMRLTIRPADLAEVVAAAIESVAPAAAGRGITVTPVIDRGIGVVPGDPDRLQQVVWNLLSNAIKFTGRGGDVRVLLEAAADHVQLTVSDTGQGIHPDFLPHVFDRFRQADSTTTRAIGGLGLGLAIVRHLTELHGGTVTASSPGDGQGATFVVRLPRTEVKAFRDVTEG